MIGVIFFVVFLAITGAYAKLAYAKNVSPATRTGKANISLKYIITICLLFVLSICVGIWQPIGCERIDAACVGLKVNLVGKDRGVSQYKFKTGWAFYNVYTEQIVEIPTSQQHAEYEATSAIAQGGFNVLVAPSFNYEVIPDNAGDMFVSLRTSLEKIQTTWLKTSAIGATNDVVNKWSVDSIFNHRAEFEQEVMSEINKKVGAWFRLSQIRTNITPPPSLQNAIENKTKAIQDAQAEKARNQVIDMQNLNKILTARGDSAEQVIAAKASAEVMRIKQLELTPLYVEYLKITQWDGKNATTLVTDGSSTSVMVK